MSFPAICSLTQHKTCQQEQSERQSIVELMTRHCYLPTVIMAEKGSQFRSEVVNQTAQALDKRISHASTKHSQTIGIFGRIHAAMKASLKISAGGRREINHRCEQRVAMNHNTSCNESLT